MRRHSMGIFAHITIPKRISLPRHGWQSSSLSVHECRESGALSACNGDIHDLSVMEPPRFHPRAAHAHRMAAGVFEGAAQRDGPYSTLHVVADEVEERWHDIGVAQEAGTSTYRCLRFTIALLVCCKHCNAGGLRINLIFFANMVAILIDDNC